MVVVRSPTVAGDLRLYNDEIRSVEGPDGLRGGPPAWPRRWYWERASGAETTPSRSPGAGVLGRMRENADLALIRPVEASTLLGGAR